MRTLACILFFAAVSLQSLVASAVDHPDRIDPYFVAQPPSNFTCNELADLVKTHQIVTFKVGTFLGMDLVKTVYASDDYELDSRYCNRFEVLRLVNLPASDTKSCSIAYMCID